MKFLKKRFANIYKSFNHNNNKFILLLQKDVHPYKFTDDFEKFNKMSLPEIEESYCHLTAEDITNADYAHTKKTCQDFKTKNIREYHDLYVQSDTFLLVDVFENFLECVMKYMSLDPVHLLCTPG